ncbi:MAG TPA: hypothetical protein VMG08_13415 [Allosphingosinicella sp.]|nr:hypothetical protein [Allosphingosinicella sp.]
MTDKPPRDEELPGFKARRTERIALAGEAARLTQDRYAVEVTVRNLSSVGFMAECAEPVRIGSWIALEVPGIGLVQAQVRWQIGARMGGMFLDPISLARCEWNAEKAEA